MTKTHKHEGRPGIGHNSGESPEKLAERLLREAAARNEYLVEQITLVVAAKRFAAMTNEELAEFKAKGREAMTREEIGKLDDFKRFVLRSNATLEHSHL